MDSEDSQNKAVRQLRRSTRQSSTARALSVEPTPRAPLKRTKRPSENKAPVPAVNGSKHVDSSSDDEDSPSKKSRLQAAGTERGAVDEHEMETQETLEIPGGNEQEEATTQPHQTKMYPGAFGDMNLHPHVVLGERCRFSHAEKEALTTERVKLPKKEPPPLPKLATQTRSSGSRDDAHTPEPTSMAEYKRKMETKIDGIPKFNHYITAEVPSFVSHPLRHRGNNIQPQKKNIPDIKQEEKKKPVAPQSSGRFLKGFLRYLWQLILVVLISSVVFLAYKNISVHQRTRDGAGHPPRSVNSGIFVDQLSLLETQFPSQRPELWKRSRIHLQKHLDTAEPTEPVSLILTAGAGAERTLHCLARSLASAFSSALNASVLHIDGASKASQESDEVKLDIDTQLRTAFEGDKPVAVIHRFEELPPGSTIIFYRYCDHEHAAYKRVFLLFTVLLPNDEVGGTQNLKEVEEMVLDYVKLRLVGNETAFNKMDTDKFGGLWSRISHLILPVLSETEVQQRGC